MSLLSIILAALLMAGAPTCAFAKARHHAPASVAKPAEKAEAPIGDEAVPAEPAHAEEAEESGLPQLNPAHWPGQAFWLILSFLIMYGLMRYMALPQVEGTLARRQAALEGDVAEAKRLNEQAKNLSAQLDQRMNEARLGAQEETRKAAEEGAKQIAAALAEQQKKLDERLREAESRIATQKQQALKALDEEAAAVVGSILKQITGTAPKPEQAKAAWQQAKEA
ncbi:MAG TPA: ATP synthase F0 subunit B [Alphaproteobacteria bacterium]|nr:ATP synthase F0 subunit B [Alphaproteobacteria bacterium]